mgnify:CR=1 FL=1
MPRSQPAVSMGRRALRESEGSFAESSSWQESTCRSSPEQVSQERIDGPFYASHRPSCRRENAECRSIWLLQRPFFLRINPKCQFPVAARRNFAGNRSPLENGQPCQRSPVHEFFARKRPLPKESEAASSVCRANLDLDPDHFLGSLTPTLKSLFCCIWRSMLPLSGCSV